MVLARPDEWEIGPFICSLNLFMIVETMLCGLIACWIFLESGLINIMGYGIGPGLERGAAEVLGICGHLYWFHFILQN